MAAGEILLRPDEARNEAENIRKRAEEARDSMSSLKTELSNLNDSFRGQSQQAFEERFDEWHTNHLQMVDALDDLSRWLDDAANQLESVDEQMGSGLRGQ